MQQLDTRVLAPGSNEIFIKDSPECELPIPAKLVVSEPSSRELLNKLFASKTPSMRHEIAKQLINDPEYRAVRANLVDAIKHHGSAYKFLKRTLDIVVSLALLILLLPVFIAVGLAIVIDNGMPILFFQTRIGRNGEKFRFYKFRSMVRNAEELKKQLASSNEASGPIFKMRNDPRITKVGGVLRRFSIDELPQLLNVLRGDISLIGPRPLVAPEAAVCDERQQKRHAVQPGLLCLREISGRSALSFDEWMELDLLYVANQSLATDLKVLIRAIPAVLAGSGAY